MKQLAKKAKTKSANPKTTVKVMHKTAGNKVPLINAWPFLDQVKCCCDGYCPRCKPINKSVQTIKEDDRLEQEANQVAAQVTCGPDPQGLHTSQDPQVPKISKIIREKTPSIKEEANEENTKVLQAKGWDKVFDIPNDYKPIQQGGMPLSDDVRSFFEPRFNYDLSPIRIHTGSSATVSARAIQARAYAMGHHLVFNSNQYRPNTTQGRKLIAHELTHSIQQGAVKPRTGKNTTESGLGIIVDNTGTAPQIQRSPWSESLSGLWETVRTTEAGWTLFRITVNITLRRSGPSYDPEAVYVIETVIAQSSPPATEVTELRTGLGTLSTARRIFADTSIGSTVSRPMVIAITHACSSSEGRVIEDGIRAILGHPDMNCATRDYFVRQLNSRRRGTIGQLFGTNYRRRAIPGMVRQLQRRTCAAAPVAATESAGPEETPTIPAAETVGEPTCEGVSGVDQAQVEQVREALRRPARQRRRALQDLFGLVGSTEEDPMIDHVNAATATCIDTTVVPEMGSRLSGSFISQIQTQLRYIIDPSSAPPGVAGSRRRQLLTEGREGEPRTTFTSGSISITTSEPDSGLDVNRIRYLLELNRSYRGEPGRYVLYIEDVAITTPTGTRHMTCQEYLEAESGEASPEERQGFLLRKVSEQLFHRPLTGESSSRWSGRFHRQPLALGGLAYIIRNPDDLLPAILTELDVQWPTEENVEEYEQMPPLDEAPEAWSIRGYSRARHGEAMEWLEEYHTEQSVTGESLDLRVLYHMDFDVARLDRGRQRWIRNYRRISQGQSARPNHTISRDLIRFNRDLAGQPVSSGSAELSELRGLLNVEGMSTHHVLEGWQAIIDHRNDWTTRGRASGQMVNTLRRMGCDRAPHVANRLAREIRGHIGDDGSGQLPDDEFQIPSEGAARDRFVSDLRRRYLLSGPSDDQVIRFWRELNAPIQSGDEGNEEDQYILRLNRAYFNHLRFPGSEAYRLTNTRTIRVRDFNHYHTGVGLYNSQGRAWPHMMRHYGVDSQFLVTLIQFCRALADMGVTRLYTAGHYRLPLSPRDSHAQGRAIDITGFGLTHHGRLHELLLSDDASASAWNDTQSRIGDGRTYRHIMLEISRIMSRYFSWISGPGRDERHNNHFHCEISRTSGGEERTLHLPSTPLDIHPETRPESR